MEIPGSKVPGLPPGTVVHTGSAREGPARIVSVCYDSEGYDATEYKDVDEFFEEVCDRQLRWIHVYGVHDVTALEAIGKKFSIHPLIMEDIANTTQRPKVDMFSDGAYVVLRSFQCTDISATVRSEQVSIVLRKNLLISFQESDEPIFMPVTERLGNPNGRLRNSGSDYLAYALMDMVVDEYFEVLESLGETLQELEDELIHRPSYEMLTDIYRLKRTFLTLRRHIWPLQEVAFRVHRDQTTLIAEETQLYLRDLHDHVARVVDHVETARDSITGMVDIYLSSTSNKMNEVMRILTVVSAIFIPLTLLASIWPMPEIDWPMSYPFFLIVATVSTLALLAHFRRIGWI
ncbi:magnesium/cobalt transporter CorA [Candidatus Thorarchaeota archaeon]|nr:MAG: magnesium/cobalt transporter CorA [Candidatus Thorarchaeota archaeon]